ncbi:MAG: hypothetical protein KatS3mg103_1303 [Phycisphaerales bacterium]|nr:MAG: hypothetical protein KatS3mg103_1303 [Phycisphaerales bacterium]
MAVAAMFVGIVALLLGACAGPSAGPAALSPEDFSASARPVLPEGLGAPMPLEPSQAVPGDLAITSASGGLVGTPRPRPLDASSFVPPPQAGHAGASAQVPEAVDAPPLEAVGPQARAVPAQGPVLLDVKVGEVNNKPIFAAEFLDPLAQRLRALAYQDEPLPGGGTIARLRPLSVWQREAAEIINQQLVAFVNNELVIAEGLASFTPAERAGLRNFLGLVRQNLARRSGGSITRAVRQLGTGQTLSEYLQDVRNQELIARFAEDLRRSVVVTRSDVQRAYLQRYGNNREPSTATFRRIRVPNEDAQGIARIADRLARGEPFDVVAQDPANTSRRSEGGLWPPLRFQGDYELATFFPNEPKIQEKVASLTPGEWVGPIMDDRFTHWIQLVEIRQGYKTWAQAQSELRQELMDRRLDDAYQRAMRRLYEQAGLEDLDAMSQELLAVATAWFYPQS